MKALKTFLLLSFISSTIILFAQQSGGGEFVFNKSHLPCLTESQRSQIIKKLEENTQQLKRENKLRPTNKQNANPLFIWPVKKAAHVTYNEVWAISNYVDHNPAYPNQITDYNGGTRSYDTYGGYNHQGTDIFIWPYSWKLFDENGLEVIAAAKGQIIYKHDGEFDMNCAFNDSQWNAIYIQHDDGSIAWYGHFKTGSLTDKHPGDMVAQGEYLGIVGSSGNSTGPHLHFEVYKRTPFNYDNLIDPYSGPSNNWNDVSWWQNQKPYRNPKINALTTNSNPPVFDDCPAIEIPNEQNAFSTNSLVYFTVLLKDQFNQSFDLKVYKPNNSLYFNWHKDLPDDYAASYWWYSGYTDNTEGEWRVECTLSTGEVVNHYFTVDKDLSINKYSLNNASIYPNPLKDYLFVSASTRVNTLIIRDFLGKRVFEYNEAFVGTKKLPVKFLPKGLYFVTLLDKDANALTFKLIKE